MLEKDIEKKLKQRIEPMGCLCWKFEVPSYTGVPDRIILLPGGGVRFVELKAPKKKERPRQLYVHRIMRALGFTVYSTVDSLEKVEAIVQDCKDYIARRGYL